MLWRHSLRRRPLPSCVSIGTRVRLRIASGQTDRFLSHTNMPHSVHSTRESTPINDEQLSLKYWNANIPQSEWTEECPPFLAGTSEKNKLVLLGRDEDFKEFTWSEVKHLIGKQNPAAVRPCWCTSTDMVHCEQSPTGLINFNDRRRSSASTSSTCTS